MGAGLSKNKEGGQGPRAEEKPKPEERAAAGAGGETTPTSGTSPAIAITEGIPTGAAAVRSTESPQPSPGAPNSESQSTGAMGDFVEAVVAKASEFGDNE